MTRPHFSLVDEPWIPVLGPEGPAEVGLREAFRRSAELRQVAAELPTQTFAIVRLLLALLHRAVQGPRDVDDWCDQRDAWDEVVEDVNSYLDAYHDRFWLQHPEHPFLQVADLRTAKDEVFGLERIICDGPGTSTFMTTRLGVDRSTMSWPEAARWLVHVHAYDVSGIKSGAVGDPRVKGGRGYPIGTGWAGQIGGVYAAGGTLRETLLLNLVAPSAIGLDSHPDADAPLWERAPLGPTPDGWDGEHYREPTGPVDLYTWPARRVRLIGDEQRVTGCLNAQGDRPTPHNRFAVEPMTAWRYSKPQTQKLKRDVYMPAKHQPGRALWRGMPALLAHVARGDGDNGPPSPRPPGVVVWLEVLRASRALDDQMIRLRSVGIEYGSNESVVDEVLADEIALPTSLLDPQGRALAEEAVDAVGTADEAVRALGRLATNVALAAGASTESDGPSDRAKEQAYGMLDGLFRRWVVTLTEQVVPSERRAAWQLAVYRTVREVADRIVAEAGPTAIVGRMAGGQFRDVGRAELWFVRKLRDVLPRAFGEDVDGIDGSTTEEVA